MALAVATICCTETVHSTLASPTELFARGGYQPCGGYVLSPHSSSLSRLAFGTSSVSDSVVGRSSFLLSGSQRWSASSSLARPTTFTTSTIATSGRSTSHPGSSPSTSFG